MIIILYLKFQLYVYENNKIRIFNLYNKENIYL